MARTNKVGSTATKVNVNSNSNSGSVEYHNTVVVEWTEKEIVLNTDNWFTVTTKLRMNQTSNQFSLGFQVWQKNYAWFINFRGETIPFDNYKVTLKR